LIAITLFDGIMQAKEPSVERKYVMKEANKQDFSDLKALFLNCTLKRSPELSHTEGLINISKAIMEKNNVSVEVLRPVDYNLAYGVYPDMTEHGWQKDEWLQIYKKVEASNILVIASPIWLGDKSSICTKTIERLYSTSGDLNAEGQYAYYGGVGGCLITGNEDGVKHCAMNILYSLQHLGYVIPPQADAGWIGEVGPGPSYLDAGSGGPENDFTNRNTTFMTWNLLHLARMIKDIGGIPAHGNQRSLWDAGCRFDHPNPEYR
jgi:multimeric flavodoxin WrbA